ncbi:hypothetical protein CC86DRAFT_404993 [Ophiobolus disseminans]|uniref:Uncharacterized protein n=1 Tax=Ophiobolus disseminans TaxID=1469910 RepID=A0A6A7A3T8_9PLEO|nr:hypothetical protein CC86DRAFT_404993 [Ophiobolus disseminans]
MASSVPLQASQQPILILVPTKNKIYQLHKLTILDNATDASIIASLRTLSAMQVKCNYIILPQMARMLDLHRLAFGTACVIGHHDPENHTIPTHHVYNIKTDEVLTSLLCAPIMPPLSAGTIRKHMTMEQQSDGHEELRVWCFFNEVDGLVAAMWALLALFVTCGVGLIVGCATGDAQLGLGVGTGLLAVFTTVHGTVLLVFKWR